jgi:GntR family transcriptional regulator / MocR family aminotransferase
MATAYQGIRHSRAGIPPIIRIDREAPLPLHKQVYEAYRTAVLRGDLRPGQQIPSSRELAEEIRVSRFPILHAYAQLLAEGYFESRVGAGTFIARSLPELERPAKSQAPILPSKISGPRPLSHRSQLYPPFDSTVLERGWGPFGVHQPAFDQFPFQVWSSLVAKHSRNPSASALHHIDPMGSERFRLEICAYLRTARSLQCDPGQIMIVSGSQQALDITARVLLDPGSPVWVEEPGYSLQRTVLMAAGCRIVPVPVDGEGMDVAKGVKLEANARAAFVTPSHQYPLGVTMSATRRLHLLNWAQRSGAWIVEDDYDSEYRFESNPVASLQGLDVNARVIYVGTFSKVLLPSLRIGYIVIPPDLVDQFAAVRFATDIFPPYLYQEVLADFMQMGHFGRHIRKMRHLYRARRSVLIECLRREFGKLLEVQGAAAGMHLTATLPESYSDREIANRAGEKRLWVWPLSPYYLGKKPRQGLVLGFGSSHTNEIPRAVETLRSLVRP